MASEKNLQSIFSDIADAIREKTKTSDLIKPYDMAEKINEISGSVDIVKPIYAEQKNPVPNTGHLEKIFFNTKLDPAQVDALITNANLTFMQSGNLIFYPILMTNTRKIISILDVSSQSGVERGAAWEICDLNSDATYYVSPALVPDDPTYAGWIQNDFTSFDTGEIAINAELVQANQGVEIGSQNNLLTDLVRITAIVDSGKVEILKTLKDQYKLVENSLEFDGSKNTTYDYDFISNINEETKEINVIKNITINGVSTLKKYLDYKKTVSNIFKNDSNLTFDELNEILSYDDTSNITDMSYMFSYCSSLTSIPELNTSKVTDMNGMFQSCSSLTTIPLLDTVSVTSMNSMFHNCSNLTSIPLLNTSNVINMERMFYNCSSLTTIPLLDTSNNTSMRMMFDECSSLTSIPELNTSKVTDMYCTFYNCSSLMSIPELDTSKVTDMNGMFYNCSSLTTIHLLNTSNVTNMSQMFQSCSSLTSIPQLNTSNVTDMGYMFGGCSSLTTVPLLNTVSVTDMSSMFRDCTNLTTIPQLNTNNVTDMSYMFYRCSSLTSIPQLDTNKVTYMNGMFKDCSSLTKVDLTDMKTTSTYYSDEMLTNCCSLTKLIIRNMTSAPSLNANAFTNCYHFTGIVNPTYNPAGLKDGRIYVPDNMVNTLKSATNWSKYADIIVPLSTLEE